MLDNGWDDDNGNDYDGDGYYDDGEDDNHYDGEGFMLHNWLHHQKQYNDGSGQR